MRRKKSHRSDDFSADLGSGVVVVRGVRATICSQCGEEWIDNATSHELERIVNDARSRGLQVEVTAFK
jgi:YgiT-type zinc finger domain-containing protein